MAMDTAATWREQANLTRYQPGMRAGHYESFFVRANHPSKPQAFWIRYTIFSPRRRPEQAVGELWAVYFDGETGEHVAVKREVPYSRCHFSSSEFMVGVDDAHMEPGKLAGSATSGAHHISWALSFRGDAEPLLLLPAARYRSRFPKAKSLVSLPMATFDGFLFVNGRTIQVGEWVGSQNHNWGSRHTDHYAWGQVAGFDTHPQSFLEVTTAKVKLGPFWSPLLTLIVLRHQGQEIALNSMRQALRAKGSFEYFHWQFRSETRAWKVEGTIEAPRAAFVGLRYGNPPGGFKHCLNSKIARCELTLTNKKADGAAEVLSTANRAAFEILTDDEAHGVEIRV